MKLVTMAIMVVVMGAGLRYARPYIMKAAGVPEIPGAVGVEGANFSSDESDLMSTVFKSALRFLSGSASRDELAGELSDKLYAGRAGAGEMSELGIELVKPDGSATSPGVGAGAAVLPPGVSAPPNASGQPGMAGQPVANSLLGAQPQQAARPAVPRVKPGPLPGKSPATPAPSSGQGALAAQFWVKAKSYSIELTLIPVVLVGMVVVSRVRRKRSPEDAFMLPELAAIQNPADTEPHEMKHPVHSLSAEDFELLIALIYQRQGYRVSMPDALSGGRGGDFMLLRKSERILVQCKRLSADHKVPVERVRELQDAVTAANATRGMFVASCSFSWDARNFAKTKGMTLINARTLDELLTAAREKPSEDLLAVAEWAPKLVSKVQFTPPQCPACEAAMDQLSVSNGSVWVCSQRPDCKGRRSARRYHKPTPAVKNTPKQADEVAA